MKKILLSAKLVAFNTDIYRLVH